MPSSIRAFAIRLGGGLRPPSDGRRAPAGALLPASPQDPIAAAKPPLEPRRRARARYLDGWVQILRRKPLGTVGGGMGVLMLAGAVLGAAASPDGCGPARCRSRSLPLRASRWPVSVSSAR